MNSLSLSQSESAHQFKIQYKQCRQTNVFSDFGYHDDNQKNLQLKQKSLIKKGQLGKSNGWTPTP